MLHILCCLVRLLSYIWPSSLFFKWKVLKSYIYTAYVSREFGYLGKKAVIHYNTYIDGFGCISIGSGSAIQDGSFITAVSKWRDRQKFSPRIEIGDGVNIGRFCHLSAINRITLKDGVLLGSMVTIIDNSHGKTDGSEKDIPSNTRELYSPGPVIVDENVWIGDKVTICPNVHIGKGAIIGANTVVTKDIPAYAIAVGIPAKVKEYNLPVNG